MPVPEAVVAMFDKKPEYAPLRSTFDDPFRGVISAADAAALMSENNFTVPELMLILAEFASAYALTGISDFNVGAVAEGVRPIGAPIGALYFGANMEFVGQALVFTVHAEQSATVNAWQNGELGMTSLAIDKAPCGLCRQFLFEISTVASLTVYLTNQPPLLMKTLLPLPFGPQDFPYNTALMDPQSHGLNVDAGPTDPVILAALAAANASYAPYTSNFSGVTVQTRSGATYLGRYGENAAFNPSISPLESALTMWNFAGDRTDTLTRCVLVEKPSLASQQLATAVVLEAFAGPDLNVEYRTAS